MKEFVTVMFCFLSFACVAQKANYADSLQKFQRNYMVTHEVVSKADRKYFRFFPVDAKFRVLAKVERLHDSTGFIMKTSGPKSKKYFRYALLKFSLAGKAFQLTVYQSEDLMSNAEYKDYLFVPFTDLTSGEKSYGGGKYIDLLLGDIKEDKVVLDFNKAYNPYCAYTTGYNCPIPPRENDLPVAIYAGEMNFAKSH